MAPFAVELAQAVALLRVPLMAGGFWLVGNAGAMIAVAEENDTPEPAALVAVSRSSRTLPTSFPTSVYLVLFAPLIGWQFRPPLSHRRHWYSKLFGSPSRGRRGR